MSTMLFENILPWQMLAEKIERGTGEGDPTAMSVVRLTSHLCATMQ